MKQIRETNKTKNIAYSKRDKNNLHVLYTYQTRKNTQTRSKNVTQPVARAGHWSVLVSPTPPPLQDNVRVQVWARPSSRALNPTPFATREAYQVVPYVQFTI